MLHDLTLGLSTTGKTTLQQQVARRLQNGGRQTAILDPLYVGGASAWGHPAFITGDRNAFLRWARSNQSADLFVDESGISVDRYDPRFDWLTTTSRHLGHRAHFIAHRLTALSPTTRVQCQNLFLFRCNVQDARALADEYGCPGLTAAASLPRYEFLNVAPCDPMRKGRIVRGALGRFRLELNAA
ncbi:MAG TPA: hypothetical protein VEK85_17155 [Gemmatimonadales bacterium]|nr:hypothetical protein [Gemmatimonadales bacterium]